MANENDTQWDDIEYNQNDTEEQNSFDFENEEENNESGSSDDYFQDDDENNSAESEEDDDTENEMEAVNPNKKTMMAVLIGLIVVILLIAVFLIVKMVSGGDSNEEAVPVQSNNQQNTAVADNSSFGNEFFEENAANDNADMMSVNFNDNGDASVTGGQELGQNNETVATVTNAQNSQNPADALFDGNFDSTPKSASTGNANANANLNTPSGENLAPMDKSQEETLDSIGGKTNNQNNSIVVSWNRVRQNPFKPPYIRQTQDDKYEKIGDVQFEIIEPPTKLVPDLNLTKLLQTQISGILYDDESPSAIVNLAGQDQFVKIGDEISGYKIKNITRNKVEISYKNNTYVASVGELFVPGRLEQQSAVANLSNKFAGRYKNEKVEE